MIPTVESLEARTGELKEEILILKSQLKVVLDAIAQHHEILILANHNLLLFPIAESNGKER
jgi:hypothetical protein